MWNQDVYMYCRLDCSIAIILFVHDHVNDRSIKLIAKMIIIYSQ